MDIIKKEIAGDIYYGYYDFHHNFIFHSECGPAVIYANGTKVWCINDNVHNEKGPAIIHENGAREWWVHGNSFTIEINIWLKERALDPDNLDEEDQLALLFYLVSLYRGQLWI